MSPTDNMTSNEENHKVKDEFEVEHDLEVKFKKMVERLAKLEREEKARQNERKNAQDVYGRIVRKPTQ